MLLSTCVEELGLRECYLGICYMEWRQWHFDLVRPNFLGRLQHEIIGEQTIADAILDQIVHDVHRIELNGEFMRKKRKLKHDTGETKTTKFTPNSSLKIHLILQVTLRGQFQTARWGQFIQNIHLASEEENEHWDVNLHAKSN